MKCVILYCLRLLVSGVFVYAGIVKALNPSQFLRDIQSYQLLPYVMAVITALYLPWLEIVCGTSLMIRKLYPGALSILSICMIVFLFALVSAWVRGLDISCGCFGSRGVQTNYPWLVLRDFLLLTVLGVLVTNQWSIGKMIRFKN